MAEPDPNQDASRLETGDAALASAAIESWLARQSQISEQDWRERLLAIRFALEKICAVPRLANDPQAQAILANMTAAQDMEELAAEIDNLCDRYGELTGFKPRRTRLPLLSRPAFEMVGKLANPDDPDSAQDVRRGRMVLKL